MISRRLLLNAAAAAGLTSCATKTRTAISPVAAPRSGLAIAIPLIDATLDRMFRVTVCLRPFRAAGPRSDIERVGDQIIIHNYGHGGSGWSLSWGSSGAAVANAMRFGERNIGVIGCGALGLTSAIQLQRAGANVTIYAKDRPPDVRSARATGMWSPDSRIALTNAVSPDFPALWEKMARASFRMHESYFGFAGNPVESTPQYILSEGNALEKEFEPQGEKPLPFAEYEDRIPDLTPRFTELESGTHPFPTRHAWRTSRLTFNIAAYAHQLVTDFLLEGGRIERKEFHAPAELRGTSAENRHQRFRLRSKGLVAGQFNYSGAWADCVVASAARGTLRFAL